MNRSMSKSDSYSARRKPLASTYTGSKFHEPCQISIAPGNVAANTSSTALVIGEKAALLIAEELGIQL